MLLEITTTAPQASDLGYMLHKNPANVYERALPYGTARVFYPEATEERCTAVLWLDLDQVGLVRRHGDSGFSLSQYVNDRPYVASSFLSVAIGQSFSNALDGRSKERQERADELWPLEFTLPAVDCDPGEEFIRAIFEPLGYTVEIDPILLDSSFPEWGSSTLYRLKLSATMRIADALTHLYVLLPVLDNQKHYAFGADEVTKLLDNAGDWLASHPMREVIARRYLRYRRQYVEDALERLAASANDEEPANLESAAPQVQEEALETPMRLHDLRLEAVAKALGAGSSAAETVLDLGCGEGRMLQLLVKDRKWRRIVGMDVSTSTLRVAARKLHMDTDRAPGRVTLLQGSLLYRDDRLCGFDTAAVVEVIEHIEPERLEFVERSIFGYARPGRVVVTTPNADYNPHWYSLPAGQFRHRDHRFEWTRTQFAEWAERVTETFKYKVQLSEIGEPDGELGAPSQMAVFDRM
jgi:3' terminal RNA ribose 2'-O-methyltransferase Hen1